MQAIKTIEYKGHSINVFYDECAANPFKDWDCEPDLLVFLADRCSYFSREYSKEYSADNVPVLTREQIQGNLSEVLDWLPDSNYLTLSSRMGRYNFSYIEDMVNQAIQDQFEDVSHSEKFDLYAAILAVQGIIALSGSVQGSCQGDYGYCLAIASNEFIKNTGANITNPDQLQGSIDLYENYAFGNVFFYSIDGALCEDSCGGFYGYEFGKNGLMEYATNAIDCAIDSARREHLNQVKQWIKAKVPLIYRNGSALA